ncbi:iron ABC transporter permease [Paenibacillus sp. DCT19]|uniref:FecCD family ABC transporter permease n=1 Tax=Paenibacillus sp. DCT19 TaxID=2211212 RepID=UPI0020C57C82|nr:iron ABC transporter permease [Paenibacillus sp. DCT19]
MEESQYSASVLSKRRLLLYTLIGLVLLILTSIASISLGAADMQFSTAWGAIFHFNATITEHQIVRTLRVPRTIADIVVGSSLALCGAIMQGTTRNPLADSGLMGISSGAVFAIALSMAFFPTSTYGLTMLFACVGAAITTGLTYFIASVGKRGMTPQRLVLGGCP